MNPVHVKFFAIFRDYIGVKEEWRDIEPGTTVQELWDAYVAQAKNPRVGNIRAAFSVNQRLAKPETVLHGGEEVGFLPPVSGGAGKTKNAPRKKSARKTAPKTSPGLQNKSRMRKTKAAARDFLVTAKPLSHDALVARVAHPGAGGIATFVGVVRDNANDKSVKFLEYEAYPELAERMLAQIGAEVHERWSDVRIAIAHRTGRLKIGEASVIIAVSAPHRAEAFAACRYTIERLKVIVPVWKKEFASDTDYWVEGPTPGDVGADKADEITAAQENEFASRVQFGVLSADENAGEIRTDLESV